MAKTRLNQFLQRIYYTPGLPTYLGSLKRLHDAASNKFTRKISKSDVEKYLLSQDVYTLHKVARKKLRNQPKVHVTSANFQWSIDIVVMQHLKKENSGFAFILTVIDVFSKFGYAEPLKTKNGPDTNCCFFKYTRACQSKKAHCCGKRFRSVILFFPNFFSAECDIQF